MSKLAYKIGLKTAEDCSSSTTLLSSAQLGKSKALGITDLYVPLLYNTRHNPLSRDEIVLKS